jgi:hypothetical protein
MIEREFIPYDRALALKELGFDEPCLAFYNGKFLESTDYNFDNDTSKDIGLCIVAPLYQQVFRWFREKYGLFGWIEGNERKRMFMYKIENLIESDDQLNCFPFKTYEEAELACIDKLIKLVKEAKEL